MKQTINDLYIHVFNNVYLYFLYSVQSKLHIHVKYMYIQIAALNDKLQITWVRLCTWEKNGYV